ncbi:hypothetical protein [Lacimicrobium alkaliphilum]|uniref:Solute-binding protein family 3/N-terminal domain-containing protein n=1 Tax=Lacimicrobium alkaliphilum TaxID=1526571 RepID=A0A0U2RNN3_9ALTE|nr:hypothetical protein [Lacimicrobium alkaliphilum]ALS98954.1 hypothetical protein AT746_12195 [Lacimicrobium alkaliphilum]
MTKVYRLIVIVLLILPCAGISKQLIQIPGPRSAYDISHDYHVKLLKLALEAGAKDKPIPEIRASMEMVEGRALRELVKGQWLDLYWLGTDKEKERQLRAIRIPTTRGLIGFRKFQLHRDTVPRMDKVTTLEALQQLVACQGTDWPDTDILRQAGLKVTTTPNYEKLFDMLQARRCDYFPRGYHDHSKELILRAQHYPDLVSYDGILLHYPFAVYFFTSKTNEELARWIERGLEKLIDNGDFIQFMQSHPLTRHIFPLTDQQNVRYFQIDNPLLPSETNYQNPRYWFKPTDFGIQLSAGDN